MREVVRPVQAEIIRRVKANKARRSTSGAKYLEHPRITFIVHSFNRISNIDQLTDGLRSLGEHELIVCEDGSVDGSCEKWMGLLDRPNDFLIRSNDLHEIRATDRAISFARSDVVCLVQDDDLIPRETSWLDAALARFACDPALAIIGGFMGFESFDPDPEKARPIWGDTDFRFVHHVNIGPYFIRRDHYEQLGGWDHSFSEPGDPGICFDSELCLRAWMSGYRVGYSFVPFKGPSGHYGLDGGTVLFSEEARERNRRKNSQRIFELYRTHGAHIDSLVTAANSGLGSR